MTAPRQVLFVAGPAPLGGSNRSLATLLEGLEGRVTRVLAAPGRGSFHAVVQERGLADELVALPRIRARQETVSPPLRRAVQVAASLRIAAAALRRRRHLAAIHANATTGLNLALPAAVLTRVPVVVWVHDPIGSAWGRRLGPVWRRLLPAVRWAAVSDTAVSVAVANGLCRAEDVRIVPNPIEARDVVAERPEPRQHTTIGYLGAPTWRKGFDLVPDLVERLSDLPVEWRLFTNRNPSEFNRPVWERLHGMPGVTVLAPDPDVRRVFAQCDVVVVPSREESFSRITAEAMLNGIPVVATDLPPMRKMLHTGAGSVFPAGAVAVAAEALRRLVADDELRRRAGAEGRVRGRAFATEGVVEQMLELYGVPGGTGGAPRRAGVMGSTGSAG